MVDKMTEAMKTILIEIMVDHGDLIRKGGDYFEDMGGHIVHESSLDYYMEEFLKQLSADELKEAVESLEKVEAV